MSFSSDEEANVPYSTQDFNVPETQDDNASVETTCVTQEASVFVRVPQSSQDTNRDFSPAWAELAHSMDEQKKAEETSSRRQHRRRAALRYDDPPLRLLTQKPAHVQLRTPDVKQLIAVFPLVGQDYMVHVYLVGYSRMKCLFWSEERLQDEIPPKLFREVKRALSNPPHLWHHDPSALNL